jgi:Ni,Fe-hydrogenase I large subunit
MSKHELMLDMNRVEGDLQLRLQLEDGVVTDAWTIGTMYRGFEQLLIGRAPMDALVITPRICGICGTGHLYAAVSALESALGCPIAPNGTRVRNVCLMAEEIQSDTRHAFLMFAIDLCHAVYAGRPDYDKVLRAFEPFKGKAYRETIVETKKLLEIVALYGGQWPHSSFMVPGGVTSTPTRRALVKSLSIIDTYTRWYERCVLGCSLDRWAENQTLEDVLAWCDEREEHRDSPVGLFVRFTRALQHQRLGRGNGNMLSYGVYFDPATWQPPFAERTTLRAGGFYDAAQGAVLPFSHREVTEHVKHSWFRDHGTEQGAHPWAGETVPTYAPGSHKYTWAKAPRYAGQVVEVGAFPELFMAGDPLTRALYAAEGTNVWARQFIRFHRPTVSLRQIRATLLDLDRHFDDSFYDAPVERPSGEGVGLVHAARGALGHWVQFDKGKITRYQVITPTGWNASPRDSAGTRGHWEQSLIGTAVADEDNPVELGHIIRSHDACLVCTVHFLDSGRTLHYGPG